MSDLIALVALIFGSGQIYLTIKSFVRIQRDQQDRKKRIPQFTKLVLVYGSFFGAILIFLGFDIIFKWI